MAANKAVNGCITANKRCHLVGLPIKTEVYLQPFNSGGLVWVGFFCCGMLLNHREKHGSVNKIIYGVIKTPVVTN